jgi:signal transduction histidine kinase
VALAFAAGALLLSVLLVSEIYAVASRYLVDQRDRSAGRQAVVNATLLSTRLTAGTDPEESLALIRTGAGVDALLHYENGWYSGAVGLGPDELPGPLTDLVGSGEPAFERYAGGQGAVVTVGVPLASGGEYYEVVQLTTLERTLDTVLLTGLAAAGVTTLLGAALGVWAARRVLRPLEDVTRTAAQLAGGDLDARMSSTYDPDLAPIAGSFNAMARTLSDRIQRDSRFAADVSHELRSPLTTMTASVSVLESRREQLPSAAQEATDLISADLARFAQLLEDLLDLSRDVAPLALDDLPEVPLVDVVRRALASHGGDVGELVVEGDTRVRGDVRRLERIVANLVENADRHGGGVIGVAVVEQGSRVRIVVDDAGPGVPVAEQEVVFERFSRGTPAQSRGSRLGTGLGLSLVREHALAHAGGAWYEDRPGGGARFVVDLPRAEP